MNIFKQILEIEKAKPYVRGSGVMWTDPYISGKLLAVHLDAANAAASRTPQAIEDTVACIHNRIKPGSKVLDLGCGPGLYTERLAALGHHMTGIDFSENSIEYASTRPEATLYGIRYLRADYLELHYEEEFDFVMMIYCDFGALVPDERMRLIEVIRKALKPGGCFFFDAITEEAADRVLYGTSWESEPEGGGFYSPAPYVCLNDCRRFPGEKSTLDQHLVVFEDGTTKLFRFWNHYFDREDVRNMFSPYGFSDVNAIEGLLKGEGPYQDHGVVFYEVRKDV